MTDPSFDPAGETDDDLMIYMSMREDEPDIANAAFAEFYRRHASYIYNTCFRAYRRQLGDVGVEDLVQDTFLRAFERAGSYTPRQKDDAEQATRSLRAWLGRIANRLFLDIRRQEERTFELVTDQNERIDMTPSPDQWLRQPSARELLLHKGFHEVLSPREREILELFVRYYDPSQDLQQPPKGMVDALCKRLNLLPQNVRQIRKRSLAKLRKYMESEELKIGERMENVASQGQ